MKSFRLFSLFLILFWGIQVVFISPSFSQDEDLGSEIEEFSIDDSVEEPIEDSTSELPDASTEIEEESQDDLSEDPIEEAVDFAEEDTNDDLSEELKEEPTEDIAKETIKGTSEEPEEKSVVQEEVIEEKASEEFVYSPQKKRYIRHPFAKKGLIRIDKNKIYYYKTKVSKQDRASSLRFGLFDPINLQNKEGKDFSSVYTTPESLMIIYDYEWQLWRGAFGKLGLKAGTGLFVTQGNGAFKTQTGLEPKEVFTFVMFPNNVSAIYRAQFWDKQWLVPYAEGGIGYYTFAEARDDDKNPDLGAKFGGALAAHGAGGVALSLDVFGTESKIELDREYGINSVWFTAEYRMIFGLHDSYDFTSNVFNAGFLVEF